MRDFNQVMDELDVRICKYHGTMTPEDVGLELGYHPNHVKAWGQTRGFTFNSYSEPEGQPGAPETCHRCSGELDGHVTHEITVVDDDGDAENGPNPNMELITVTVHLECPPSCPRCEVAFDEGVAKVMAASVVIHADCMRREEKVRQVA